MRTNAQRETVGTSTVDQRRQGGGKRAYLSAHANSKQDGTTITYTREDGLTTIRRPYDQRAMAQQLVDEDGMIWERRLLINGLGPWYVVGAYGRVEG